MLELGLTGKRALVLGAGRGIGRTCVLGLCSAGARVACFDSDPERGRAVAEEARAAGAETLSLHGDARRRRDVEEAVGATVDGLGGIDVAIDVIGEARWGRALELTDADWGDSFDLVLRHVFYLAQASGRQMVTQGSGGAIVSIASVSGLFAAPLHAAYGAAKAGLIALTRTLAIELAAARIRVNTVAPGAILTPRLLDMTTPERRAESAASIPLGRLGEPEEVAKAVVFLASDLASYVTGQTLVVDGGASVKFPLSLRS
jgi:NAD(P)-dependent dehydrogenase (short-subunit alcohol dehydrogenase family)